jgi:adapter protein MecA 1/2
VRIEKISDNQLRVILSRAELMARNIEVTELVNGSAKMNSLLSDMMEVIFSEFNFEFANSTIVVEVSNAPDDTFVLLVTKMNEPSKKDIENTVNFLSDIVQIQSRARSKPKNVRVIKKTSTTKCCFSFDELDDCIACCNRLYEIFEGESLLVKKDNIYFLVLNNTQLTAKPSMDVLESILSEYGNKVSGSSIFEQHLIEHGEVIIADYATIKLAKYI